MTARPQPDYSPESRIVHIPAAALVEMRDPQNTYIDSFGVLGLGQGDLIKLTLPKFQRGLKWDQEKVSDFHDSLMQGWPIGVIVIAVQSSRLINEQTGQREHSLSLIDGQQRAFALTELTRTFWKQPRISFANPKWISAEPPSGPVHDAGVAVEELSRILEVSRPELESWVSVIARDHAEEGFAEFVGFLDRLRRLGADGRRTKKPEARIPANALCAALVAQFQQLKKIPVPALVIGEILQPQLPTIFRRLNEGIPLKGYDLLAAMWDSAVLHRQGTPLTQHREQLLRAVLGRAELRIQKTYEEAGSGYDLDPNAEPVDITDLSLFDYLYFLGAEMHGERPCFKVNAEVLAFQTAALTLRGSIAQVDDRLRGVFPCNSDGTPDAEGTRELFSDSTKHIASALKPLMDVSVARMQLKGQLGLTPTVVYASIFLTHHNIVRSGTPPIKIEKRGTAVADKLVRPGVFMTATERLATLKRNLPAWYLHDMLTSVFAGSRAYEQASNRVYANGRLPAPANTMFDLPSLESMAAALKALWNAECDVDRTPQRRRVSDLGAILFRTAYSHAAVHDTVIDHVMAFTKGRAASDAANEVYPLNHIANVMPLAESINSRRRDAPWDTFYTTLIPSEKTLVDNVLLVDASELGESWLGSAAAFRSFLKMRFHAVVDKALQNVHHDAWISLAADAKQEQLEWITN
jgi:hypothetical protein